MLQGLRFAHLLLGLGVLLLVMVLACGEEATPTAAPDEDISSVVQQAVEQALGSQAAGAADAGPSSEEIAQMVRAAVAASATEGMSPETDSTDGASGTRGYSDRRLDRRRPSVSGPIGSGRCRGAGRGSENTCRYARAYRCDACCHGAHGHSQGGSYRARRTGICPSEHGLSDLQTHQHAHP